MSILAPNVSYIDLAFQGQPRIIASALLWGADGLTIVDPGPSTTLPALKAHLAAAGATLQDVTALFVTHIHLDHAGASGALVRENPRLKVYVHDVGAPHMADPAKLLASATRLYGDQMKALWGEVLPVERSAIVALNGGERIAAGGRTWEVAYTPGHASHHVSYFSPDAGIAFVGDTCGVRISRGEFVLPPTPPPDIDIPRWLASLDAIAAWHPGSLFLTHFGPVENVAAHIAELREHLDLCVRLAREAIARSTDATERESSFIAELRAAIARRVSPGDLQAYELAGRFDLNWKGLERYLRKKGEAGTV